MACDPNFDSVGLLINFDGPNGAAYFTDLSNTSIGLNVAGSAAVTNSSTVFGIGALSLPTNGDNLATTVPVAGGNLDLSTGDFTIECWVNFSATGSSGLFFEDTSGSFNWAIRINGADIFATIANGGSTQIFSGVTPAPNTWYHVTLVRQGNNFGIAVGGAWGTTYVGSGANGAAPNTIKLTGVAGATLLIDEARITKGVARYTPGTPFTPSTAAFGTSCDAPLADYNFAQVSLLMHFDGSQGSTTFTDSSNAANVFAIYGGSPIIDDNVPRFGTGAFSSQSPSDNIISPVSGPVAGGSPLDLSTGDFTIEGWVNLNLGSASGVPFKCVDGAGTQGWTIQLAARTISAEIFGTNIFSVYNAAPNILDGQWAHFACVRQGDNFAFATNGIFGSTSNQPGQSLNMTNCILHVGPITGSGGFLDELRITKGFARYTPGTNFIPSLLPFAGSAPGCDPYWTDVSLLVDFDGTNGQTTFTDLSTNAFAITNIGGAATVSTANPKFGSGAILPVGGTGAGGLQIPASGPPAAAGPLDLSVGDFTVECWAWTTAPLTAQGMASCFNPGSDGWKIQLASAVPGFSVHIYPGSPTDVIGPNPGSSVTANTWYHVAFVRQGNNFGLAVNGVFGTTLVNANSLGTPTSPLYFGTGETDAWDGFVDEMRITKGVARYSPGTNFTPPNAAFGMSCAATVPNVLGDTSSVATAAILAAGLVVGTVTTQDSNSIASGSVVSQSPIGGTSLTAGDPVNLIESDGLPACDPDWTSVSLLIEFDGAQGATTFTDISTNALSLTNSGTVTVDTSTPQFGSGAGVFDGTGSLSHPVVAGGPLDLSSGDWTVEGWMFPTHVGYFLRINDTGFGPGVGAGGFFINALGLTNPVIMELDGDSAGPAITSGGSLAPSTWTHFAFVAHSGLVTGYLGGVGGTPVAQPASSPWTSGGDLWIGNIQSGTQFQGEMDEIRITKGVARYTSNFTPPAQPFGVRVCSVTVPNVVGQPLATGESNIVAAGLVVGTVTTASSMTVPSGDIISSSPVAGTVVSPGSSVDLVESTGPVLSVPNVVGEPLATAESNIVTAGLTVGTVTSEQSLAEPYGDVISQSPVGGTPAAGGDPVDLLWATSYSTPVLSGSIPNPLSQPRTVVLTWTESVFGITPAPGYDIRRNGVTIALVGAVLTYTDTVPSPGAYTYTVAGYDPGVPGDVSFQSNAVPIISAGSVVGFPNFINDEAIFGGYFGGQLNLVEFTYMPGRTPFVQGATNLIINRYKQEPTDVRQRGIDFSQFVVPGEILQTVALAGISAQGVLQQDTNPLVTPLVVDNILIDPVTNLKVGYTVSGGQNGIEYTVQFATTTNIQAQTLEEIFSINILIEDMFP